LGKKDTITKDYMRDPVVFADAFNQFLYHGRQVIKPENLVERDTAEMILPYESLSPTEPGASVPEQKYQDEMKLLMTDGNVAYCILGEENQSGIHYAMPVKNLAYDSMQLTRQVSDAARSHKKEKAAKPTAEEYLSGFYKTDRLVPVITLVVSFTPQAWDAPMSLHDLFLPALRDTQILSFVPDYRINLLSPASMQGDELERLKTDLRTVFLFIRYSQDREQLRQIIENDPRFHTLDRTAAEVINATTGAKIDLSGKEKKINMCKAIQEMREIEFAQGHSLGMEQGVQEGRQQGIQQGLQEGIRAFIQNYREENLPMERLAAKLQKFFSLSEEEAKLSIEKYS